MDKLVRFDVGEPRPASKLLHWTVGIFAPTQISRLVHARWVEMMAPVFSKAAWRCAWYMLQNDLIHAWGLDMQLGYCAQGDRTMKVGVVDEEYIVHLGLPTLGGFSDNNNRMTNAESPNQSSRSKNPSDSESSAGGIHNSNNRSAVRQRSYTEMLIFRNRWGKAVKEDECWVDPFIQSARQKKG